MLNQIAQEIAMTASSIIDRSVLITNESGIVIGASDQTRLQTFHEASLLVIKQRQTLHHDEKAVRFLQGTKPGLTMPIEIGDNVLGTVGISGVPEEVSRYGLLIKTMVELFLKERMEMQSARLRDESRHNLLQEIIGFNPNCDEESVIISHGHSLGYNLRLPRMAAIVEVQGLDDAAELIEKDVDFDLSTSRTIKQIFDNSQHLRAALSRDRYVIFIGIRTGSSETEAIAMVREKCDELAQIFDNRGVDVRIGIGGMAAHLGAMRQSYNDAHQALAIGKMINQKDKVLYINDMYLEKLIYNIPKDSYRRFFDKHLETLCRQKDGEELCRVIRYWCESGFKATEAAKRLNIHKNTLAYRLLRIEKFTGLDLHDFRDTLSLYLTVCLHSLKEDKS